MALNIFDLFKKSTKKSVSKSADGTQPEKTPPEILAEGMMNVRDIIAPSAIEVDFNDIRVGDMYYRTFFVSGYPRFVGANWLSPVINFDHTLLISMFYYPVKSKVILDDLRKKITELEATTMTNREKGKISDPVVEAALEDATALQEQLVKGVEKYFQFSFYITIPAYDKDELNSVSSKLESLLASLLLISKTAALQMEDAFRSCIPTGIDRLMVARNMDTTSLATTFPFTSSDLTMEEGIMYGINRHNGSLVIFDRFSMENANSVVFAKSGAGKSYFVKLEALRHLVFGAQVMIIDPEEEYYNLCEVVGGNFIGFSANSKHKINPFDLSGIATEGENELGQKLISLVTLLKLMLGQLSSSEEAILDRALIETYRMKGITTDPDTQSSKEPPVMEDLYKVLLGGSEPESKSMADRLEKFIKGSMAGIFDSQSNINLESSMTVFSTKNLEDALRPIAFYMILDFVWTTIRRDLRKRILIVEEAWYLMQNPDSARFIYGIAKRARKYYLGLTTISQDVDDFLTSEYGKAVVTNSSIQMLFKQHPAAIDKVVETFYLSEGEKRFLLSAGVGEGLFFAGSNHVAIKVMASESENNLITTNPEEVLRLKEERRLEEKKGQLDLKRKEEQQRMEYKPYKAPEPMDKYTTIDELGNTKPEFKPVKEQEDENKIPDVEKVVSEPQQKPQQKFQAPEIPKNDNSFQKDQSPVVIDLNKKPQASNVGVANNSTPAFKSEPASKDAFAPTPKGVPSSEPVPTPKSVSSPEPTTPTAPAPAPTTPAPIPATSVHKPNYTKPASATSVPTPKEVPTPEPVSTTPAPAPNPVSRPIVDKNTQQQPPQPAAQKPKNVLDNKIIELRKKMLQDDDSFLDNTPSANEIMESVEEMKRNKPVVNSQPSTQSNPTNQQSNQQ